MKASFRDYVNTLRKNDELLEIHKPVDLRNVAALVAQSEKAILFKNLPGYSMPVVSGLLQSRNRIALGMGVAYENIAEKLGAATVICGVVTLSVLEYAELTPPLTARTR